MKEHPELVAMFEERRRLLDEQLERKWPDVYALVLKQREKDSRLNNKQSGIQIRASESADVPGSTSW